jgi:cysteine synthase A
VPTACASSVLELIGNTPAISLNRIMAHYGLSGRLIVKLENLNPGGSKKDRVALQMVKAAKDKGILKPGQPVVEVTSGNTGTGLAIVCKALGHPFYAVMSAGNTRERAQMMRAFGAHVVLVEQAPGGASGRVSGADMKLVKETAARLVAEKGAYFTDQFENHENSIAHELTTGPELWEQTGGKIDALVAFVGSGGAMAGLCKYLRSKNPNLHAYIVEPAGVSALAQGCCFESAHAIQGGGYGRERLSLMGDIPVDGYLKCTDDEAAKTTRLLAEEEGILGGYSSGAQLHAAVELLQGKEKGKTVCFLVCDSGTKYFSTPLYP